MKNPLVLPDRLPDNGFPSSQNGLYIAQDVSWLRNTMPKLLANGQPNLPMSKRAELALVQNWQGWPHFSTHGTAKAAMSEALKL